MDTIQTLRQQTGMTQKAFSEYFGIPKRSVENWEEGQNKCTPYLIDLIRYKIEREFPEKEEAPYFSPKLCATTIKTLRQQTGMTQKAFSEYFRIPKRTIERWEGGQRTPPPYLIDLICYKIEREFPEKS